jgi:hypothetical protein
MARLGIATQNRQGYRQVNELERRRG